MELLIKGKVFETVERKDKLMKQPFDHQHLEAPALKERPVRIAYIST